VVIENKNYFLLFGGVLGNAKWRAFQKILLWFLVEVNMHFPHIQQSHSQAFNGEI
jgi:hypothetical protein